MQSRQLWIGAILAAMTLSWAAPTWARQQQGGGNDRLSGTVTRSNEEAFYRRLLESLEHEATLLARHDPAVQQQCKPVLDATVAMLKAYIEAHRAYAEARDQYYDAKRAGDDDQRVKMLFELASKLLDTAQEMWKAYLDKRGEYSRSKSDAVRATARPTTPPNQDTGAGGGQPPPPGSGKGGDSGGGGASNGVDPGLAFLNGLVERYNERQKEDLVGDIASLPVRMLAQKYRLLARVIQLAAQAGVLNDLREDLARIDQATNVSADQRGRLYADVLYDALQAKDAVGGGGGGKGGGDLPGGGHGTDPPPGGHGNDPPGGGHGTDPPPGGHGTDPPGGGHGEDPPGGRGGGEPGGPRFSQPPHPFLRGLRVQDDTAFRAMAKQEQAIILVRDSNAEAVRWIGREGFAPKPEDLKCKTHRGPPGDPRNGLVVADPNDDRLHDLLRNWQDPNGQVRAISYDEYKSHLWDKGYRVDEADGYIVTHRNTGTRFYSDADLHGMYDMNGQDIWNEARIDQLNAYFDDVRLIQHGPHDNWDHRNEFGPNQGPQPPVTAYLPDGNAVHLRNQLEMIDFYTRRGIDFGRVYESGGRGGDF